MAESPCLILTNVKVSFGNKTLFEGLDLKISRGQRACMVGRNGCGKSTLMKVMAGTMDTDEGERYFEPGFTVGFLSQEAIPSKAETLREHVMAGSTPLRNIPAHEADAMLGLLKMNPLASLATLSGGERRRADLARVLALDPEILLLDEPTNHLDIGIIEWLEEYLQGYRGALLLISHDRQFLQTVTNHTFWLDRGNIYANTKGFSAFEPWSESILEMEERTLMRLNKKLAQETDWLHKGVTARRKRNQGRLRRLHDLRDVKRQHVGPQGRVIIPPPTPDSESKMVIEAHHIFKQFTTPTGPLTIAKDFSIRLLKGDRLGIIGNNGSGKTTLLKLLLGQIPVDEGKVRIAKNLEVAYADQTRAALKPHLNLWQTLCEDGGDHVMVQGQSRHVVAYLKDFLFDEKIIFNNVGTLSGGEKNRLMLAKILTQSSSLMVLDEPTNDLDMDTLDVLEEILSDYQGTLLLVSHDRNFLDRIATSTLVLNGNGDIQEYVGGYSETLLHRTKPAPKAIVRKSTPPRPTPPTLRTGGKLSYKFEHAQEVAKQEIERLTHLMATLEEQLSDGNLYQNNPEGFTQITQALEQAKGDKAKAEETWLEVEMMREDI